MAHSGKFISYLRVSTARQGSSGLGVEAQRAAVEAYLNGGYWTLIQEFVEVESGRNTQRPQLAAALSACRLHGATLVVAKLDRLSRNAGFLLNLQDSGVKFVAADNPQVNEMVVGILAVVAQAEGKMISDRTKAALAAAKARGKRLGSPRPITRKAQLSGAAASLQERRRLAAQWNRDALRLASSAYARAGTLAGAAALLNDEGLPARRGGSWSAAQVRRVLESRTRLRAMELQSHQASQS